MCLCSYTGVGGVVLKSFLEAAPGATSAWSRGLAGRVAPLFWPTLGAQILTLCPIPPLTRAFAELRTEEQQLSDVFFPDRC